MIHPKECWGCNGSGEECYCTDNKKLACTPCRNKQPKCRRKSGCYMKDVCRGHDSCISFMAVT